MSKATVTSGTNHEEVWSSERLFVRELLNEPGIPEVSLARCRVPPGTTTELHELSVREWYVIAEGSGLMELDSTNRFAVGRGDTVAIPARTSQRITNTGDTDLVFQCICIPRFTPDCYKSLEEV